MPPRRTNRRRPARRSRQTGLQRYTAPRADAFPFPQSIVSESSYSDQGILTNTVGVFSNYVFRMNSTYDPDVTGGGHQPYGRDILASVYAKYRVTHFKATVTYSVNTAGQNAVVGQRPYTTSAATTVNQIAESPFGSMKLTAQSATPAILRTRWISLARWLGQTDAQFLADDSNESVVGNNPTTGAFFEIASQNAGANTITVSWDVKLTYRTQWFYPITEAQS